RLEVEGGELGWAREAVELPPSGVEEAAAELALLETGAGIDGRDVGRRPVLAYRPEPAVEDTDGRPGAIDQLAPQGHGGGRAGGQIHHVEVVRPAGAVAERIVSQPVG